MVDQTKQVRIRNFTVSGKEQFSRMVEEWVAGDLVWEKLEVMQEVRDCIKVMNVEGNTE